LRKIGPDWLNVFTGLLGKWKKRPHICAYVDLSPNHGAIPPWTRHGGLGGYREGLDAAELDGSTEGKGFLTLGMLQTKLEEALESLTRNAVEMGYLNSENVLDAVLERHSIDGALSDYLKASGEAKTKLDAMSTKSTKEKWMQCTQAMKEGGEVLFNLNLYPNLDTNSALPLQHGQSRPHSRKKLSTSKAQSSEETLISLGVAKKVLKIQENWKVAAASHSKSQGVITRTLADATTSWAVLLLRLLSFAAQEGHFQVIHSAYLSSRVLARRLKVSD
jgi:hypothetical protein